jgi:hypothetical protein
MLTVSVVAASVYALRCNVWGALLHRQAGMVLQLHTLPSALTTHSAKCKQMVQPVDVHYWVGFAGVSACTCPPSQLMQCVWQ